MKLIRSFMVLLVVAFGAGAMACPPAEGVYSIDIKSGKNVIGKFTNTVSRTAGESSIKVSLANGMTLAAFGATSIQFGEEITFTGLLRLRNGEYVIANRSLDSGERISFVVKAGTESALVKVVNGRFGSRPRGTGCGGELSQDK